MGLKSSFRIFGKNRNKENYFARESLCAILSFALCACAVKLSINFSQNCPKIAENEPWSQ